MNILPRSWLHAGLSRTRGLFSNLIGSSILGVRICAFDDQGRVILVRHSYQPGWYLPGGGVDAGESIFAAAQRELMEETGYRPDAPVDLFGLYHNPSASPRDHVALVLCRRVVPPDAPRRPDHEIAEVAAVAPDNLPGDTTPATRRRLAEVTLGRQTTAIW